MNGGFYGMFVLIRTDDVTGVSGTGHVADGAEFPDGTVVVRWRGQFSTTTVHKNLASVQHIHLHGGKTKLFWRTRVCSKCIAMVAVEGSELRRESEHGDACNA